MVNWFEQACVKPTRVHYCNSSSVGASLVRRSVGISLFASELFQEDVLCGGMSVILVRPAMRRINYFAAYIPPPIFQLQPNFPYPQIPEFAREERRFLRKSKLFNPGNWSNI
jgi:hypothetical protein